MGLLEGGVEIKKWRSGLEQSSAVVPGHRSAFSLTAGILPYRSLSMPGAARQPAQAQTTCGTEGLGDGCAGRALCWVWTLWGWEKLCPPGTAPQDCWHAGGSPFIFPPQFSLKGIISLNPRFSSRTMRTILFSPFLSTLNTLRLNCRFSVILPSQVKARKEIRSIPPARTLARLLSCGPQVRTHLCFRDVSSFSNAWEEFQSDSE